MQQDEPNKKKKAASKLSYYVSGVQFRCEDVAQKVGSMENKVSLIEVGYRRTKETFETPM